MQIKQIIVHIKKNLMALLITSLMLLQGSSIAFAHGGEDHGDDKTKTPVASVGSMNTKLVTVKNLEVLIKYPVPKFGEETSFRVFITETVTNTPVGGVNLTIAFNYMGNNQEARSSSSGVVFADTAVQASATPTDTPGVYLAKVTFPDRGQYDMALQLTGSNINEQVTISGFVVPEKARDNTSKTNLNAVLALFAVLGAIFIAVATWYFWLRPRRLQQADAGAGERLV